MDYWLGCGLGLAPLAILTNEASGDLDGPLNRLRENLQAPHVEESVAKSLLGSTYVLCGLRYDRSRIADLFRRLSMLMEESTKYEEILEEGRTKGLTQGITEGLSQGRTDGLRSVLLRQGNKCFGKVPASVDDVLQSPDPYQLELLAERMLDVTSWDDLIGGKK